MIPKLVNNKIPFKKDYQMFIIDQHRFTKDSIKVTMTPTSGFVAGITLNFVGGTITIDWKDGTIENFTSTVEKTHTYVNAGTYVAEIYGDLINITGFTADNCRITNIENLKTGLLTGLNLQSNLISGNLDLSLAPISGTLQLYTNTISSITFASSGNQTLSYCRLLGLPLINLDFSNVPVSGLLDIYNCTSLETITFKNSGNGKLTSFGFYNTKLVNVDLSHVPISGTISGGNNIYLESIIFSNSGNTIITSLNLGNTKLSALDLSNVPIGGVFGISTNALLTSLSFSSTGNANITSFTANSCNFSSLNLSMLTFSGVLQITSNPNLNSITFSSSGNGTMVNFQFDGCNLDYTNFTTFNMNANSIIFEYQDNGATAADVNHTLFDLDSISNSGYTGRSIKIGGTNADPDSSSGGYNGLAAKTSLEGKGFTVTIT